MKRGKKNKTNKNKRRVEETIKFKKPTLSQEELVRGPAETSFRAPLRQKDIVETRIEDNKAILGLGKKIYGAKNTLDNIGRDFSELAKTEDTINIDKLFNIYEDLFYDISKQGEKSHYTLINQSQEYLNSYENPKEAIVENLISDIEVLDNKLGEKESKIPNSHPIFVDGTFLMIGVDGFSISGNSTIWVMQEGVKRAFKNYQVYKKTKRALGNSYDTPDTQIVQFVSTDTINNIKSGPDIMTDIDLSIPIGNITTTNVTNESFTITLDGSTAAQDEWWVIIYESEYGNTIKQWLTSPSAKNHNPWIKDAEIKTSKKINFNKIISITADNHRHDIDNTDISGIKALDKQGMPVPIIPNIWEGPIEEQSHLSNWLTLKIQKGTENFPDGLWLTSTHDDNLHSIFRDLGDEEYKGNLYYSVTAKLLLGERGLVFAYYNEDDEDHTFIGADQSYKVRLLNKYPNKHANLYGLPIISYKFDGIRVYGALIDELDNGVKLLYRIKAIGGNKVYQNQINLYPIVRLHPSDSAYPTHKTVFAGFDLKPGKNIFL